MSSGFRFACAASTSLRVGELRHCIVKLLAAKSAVPRKLIVKCRADDQLLFDLLVMEVKKKDAKPSQLISDDCKVAMFIKKRGKSSSFA